MGTSCLLKSSNQSLSYQILTFSDICKLETTSENIPNFEQLKKHGKLEEINRFKAGNSKAVSYFYNVLTDLVESDTTTIRKAWEEDLGFTIEDAQWEECLQNIHDCSINTRHNLIQFKSLHRVYMCKTKLHKIFPEVSPVCNKCKVVEGTLLHSFWTCCNLHKYWTDIFDLLSKVYKKDIVPDPMIAIFGVISVPSVSSYERQGISLFMVLAKRLILQRWKLDIVPTFDVLLSELAGIIHIEKLRFIGNDKLDIFWKIWKPVLDHLGMR